MTDDGTRFERASSWVEVSGEAIRHNVGQFRARVGPAVRLAAVVKSNAYGHGAVPTAPATL